MEKINLENVAFYLDRAEKLDARADHLNHIGDYEPAESLYREALEIYGNLPQDNLADPNQYKLKMLGVAFYGMARMHEKAGDFTKAADDCKIALEIARSLAPIPLNPHCCTVTKDCYLYEIMCKAAFLYNHKLHDFAAAESFYREAAEVMWSMLYSPYYTVNLDEIAQVEHEIIAGLRASGNHAAAESEIRETILKFHDFAACLSEDFYPKKDKMVERAIGLLDSMPM